MNIPALREAIADGDVYIVGTEDEVLLALVEAVEAAQYVRDGRDLLAADDAHFENALDQLEDKLAVFEFDKAVT